MIRTIDCHYLMPRFAASFLVKEGNEAAFVEVNTAHALPLLLKALEAEQLTPEQVRYVIVTHAHLDHAGGASVVMRACPRATLLAHPKAARHLIDPTRLIASATRVYGEQRFKELYGEIHPIDPARVRAMEDGEELKWGNRTLRFLHTRGHANHHFCVHDANSDTLFSGDAFGLAYPDLQSRGLFIFPSTSPTEFEPATARESVSRIESLGLKHVYLTHFGEVTQVSNAAGQLREWIDFSERLLERAVASALSDGELESFCQTELRNRFQSKLGSVWDKNAQKVIELDLELNGAGIAYVARKMRSV